jgi:hypothetical protein
MGERLALGRMGSVGWVLSVACRPECEDLATRTDAQPVARLSENGGHRMVEPLRKK